MQTIQFVIALPCEMPPLLSNYKRVVAPDGQPYSPLEAAVRTLAVIEAISSNITPETPQSTAPQATAPHAASTPPEQYPQRLARPIFVGTIAVDTVTGSPIGGGAGLLIGCIIGWAIVGPHLSVGFLGSTGGIAGSQEDALLFGGGIGVILGSIIGSIATGSYSKIGSVIILALLGGYMGLFGGALLGGVIGGTLASVYVSVVGAVTGAILGIILSIVNWKSIWESLTQSGELD